MTTYKLEHPTYDSISVTCVDPRFISATQSFLRDIGLKAPFPIQIAGGVCELSTENPTGARLHEVINVLSTKIKDDLRIVLINHEDCAWYKYCGGGTVDHCVRDLQATTKIIQKNLPNAKIECYMAKINHTPEGENITFESLS